MPLHVFAMNEAGKEDFVDFWSDRYTYVIGNKDWEPLYQENIQHPLTSKKIFLLYKWKNRSTLSSKKEHSVRENYVNNLGRFQELRASTGPGEFLELFDRGGTIWRIFWLHCWQPERFPIFDQHVYRAMKFIQAGRIQEIPQNEDQKKMAYLNEYLPFWSDFVDGVVDSERRIDKALVTFGKFVKAYGLPV